MQREYFMCYYLEGLSWKGIFFNSGPHAMECGFHGNCHIFKNMHRIEDTLCNSMINGSFLEKSLSLSQPVFVF